jgi:hypothetical protein
MRFALLQNLLTENLGLMYLSAYLQRQGNESRVFLPADLQCLLRVAIEETLAHHCCPNWTPLKFRSLVIAAEIRGQRRDLKTRAHVCRPDGSLMQGLSIFARTGSPL